MDGIKNASFLLVLMQQLCYAQVNVLDIPISTIAGNNQTENAVFISPLSKFVIINSNNSTFDAAEWDVSYFISTNGGQVWTGNISGPDPNSLADPSVIINRSGRIVTSNLTTSPSPRHINVSYTDDNGASWTTVQIPGSFVNADKQYLWVDNNLHSPYEGRIYMAFNDQSSGFLDIVITYSADGGVSWLAPPLVNIASTVLPPPAFENLGVNIQTGPQGQVYACWSAIDNPFSTVPDNTRIYFNKSTDGGDTWLSNAKDILTTTGAGLQLGGGKSGPKAYPFMAVNQQTGTIYLAWARNNGIPGTLRTDADIYMIKSEDEGDTWSAPIRVNQDPIGNFKDQWSPWIACDEISNALVVMYYDSRNFPANPATNRAETFISISYDDGNSWEDHQISDVGEDWSGNFYSVPGMDYNQVDVYHGFCVPVWSDNRPAAGSDFRAYVNPFEVPCPQDLDLIYGDYNIYDQGDYTDYPNQLYDGLYRAIENINVAGSGSTYKVHLGAEVLMEAGIEIVLNDGFECEGEFQAIPGLICVGFSERKGDVHGAHGNNILVSENLTVAPGLVSQYMVYPNPSNNGTFRLQILGAYNKETVNVELMNILGETVYQSSSHSTNQSIDISHLGKGIYLLKVQNGKDQYVQKIVYNSTTR